MSLVVSSCVFKVVDPLAPKLRGDVQSRTGQPQQGVQIALTKQGRSVTTGADGTFDFKEVPREELDVLIESRSKSSLTLDPLEPGKIHELRITLDQRGSVTSLEVATHGSTNAIADVFHALTRPGDTPNSQARGTIVGEEFIDGDQELSISLERMGADLDYDVFLEPQAAGGNPRFLGTTRTDFLGRVEFDIHNFGLGAVDEDLQGRVVTVRRPNNEQVFLKGGAPAEPQGRRKGKADINPPMGASNEKATGFVMIKNTPPGRGDSGGDTFEVEIQHLLRNHTYLVCIECPTVTVASQGGANAKTRALPTNSGSRMSFPRLAAVEDTFRLGTPIPVGGMPGVFDVPILANLSENTQFFKFMIEYGSDCFTDPNLTSLAVGADFEDQNGVVIGASDRSLNVVVTTFGSFNNAFANRRVVVTMAVTNPGRWIPSDPSDLEIARLRFALQPSPPAVCAIGWDDRDTIVSTGSTSPTNFVTTTAGRNILPDEIFFVGPVIVPQDPFICFAEIETNGGGNGKLKLKQKDGDEMPCMLGVEFLQGARLQVRDADTDEPVLEGAVPNFAP